MRVGEIRHPERAQFGAPLAGVRILDVEQMQALPYATRLMAHLGAVVVKVEHTDAILCELLGFGDAEIAALREADAI